MNQIELLREKPCWGVASGSGNGSMVTLHLGERISRRKPLPPISTLSEIQLYQGEYCLFVKGCAWRIRDQERVIGGWAEPKQTIQKLTDIFVGCTLTNVECINDALDLRVQFANRYILDLFCDRTSDEDELDNYSLRTPRAWYTIGPKSRLQKEPTNIGG